MNRNLFAFVALFCIIALSFSSCGDDDNDTPIDYEWVAHSDNQVAEVAKEGSGYTAITSQSNNGKIYYRKIDFFAETPTEKTVKKQPKITNNGTPYYTDSIAIRYEGRFYLKDGTPYIFDTTEGDTGNSRIVRSRVNNFIDGFSTMLQNMRLSDGMDEVEVCIPYRLGYNATPKSNNNVIIIPAYTTLWFKIKLLAIYPDNPGEFD